MVLAVLVAESYHRGRLQRTIEYCAWFLLSLFRSRRVERLSVGISQAQVRNWVAAGLLASPWWSPAAMRTALSAASNYDVSAFVLQRWFPSGIVGLVDVSRHYTGGASTYYADLLAQVIARVDPHEYRRQVRVHVGQTAPPSAQELIGALLGSWPTGTS